jgi:ArsR family transcriptional regulator
VYYRLTSLEVAELLAAARQIVTSVLTGLVELLEGLRSPSGSVGVDPAARR